MWRIDSSISSSAFLVSQSDSDSGSRVGFDLLLRRQEFLCLPLRATGQLDIPDALSPNPLFSSSVFSESVAELLLDCASEVWCLEPAEVVSTTPPLLLLDDLALWAFTRHPAVRAPIKLQACRELGLGSECGLEVRSGSFAETFQTCRELGLGSEFGLGIRGASFAETLVEDAWPGGNWYLVRVGVDVVDVVVTTGSIGAMLYLVRVDVADVPDWPLTLLPLLALLLLRFLKDIRELDLASSVEEVEGGHWGIADVIASYAELHCPCCCCCS